MVVNSTFGYFRFGRTVLVRRVLRDERPLLRLVGIAVFGHPARAGEKLAVALHVEQGHLDDHRVEKLRALRQRDADEQSAVAATHDPEVRGDVIFRVMSSSATAMKSS